MKQLWKKLILKLHANSVFFAISVEAPESYANSVGEKKICGPRGWTPLNSPQPLIFPVYGFITSFSHNHTQKLLSHSLTLEIKPTFQLVSSIHFCIISSCICVASLCINKVWSSLPIFVLEFKKSMFLTWLEMVRLGLEFWFVNRDCSLMIIVGKGTIIITHMQQTFIFWFWPIL